MKPSTASELVDPGIPGCHGGFASRHFSAGDTGAARLVVTGNPNVGKSVIFQLLTGRYTTVSNYPGTTVVVARGSASLDGTTFQVCDTPGLNSLHASSEDELVARDLLLAEGVRVVQVSDAKNLPRALTLTLELAEAGAPAVLNLNMMDEARERGVAVDVERLSALLGIPVVQTIATQRWGIEKLRRAIPQARPAQLRVRYPGIVEEALARIVPLLPAALPARTSVALLWLAGDQAMRDRLAQRLDLSVVERLRAAASEAQARSSRPLGLLISHARLREAKRLAAQVMTAASREPRTPVVRGERRPALQRLGDLAMHPVWGVPILAGALFLMYVLVGDLAAQRGVEFFEKVVFGRYVVPAAQWVVRGLLPWPWWQALFIGEYGLVTMAAPYAFAIILPIVGMFFLFFGLIEDVGYLPRLAVMANRFCKLLGLNGKAVLPLVLGLGCDTMATMTTRILDTKRDRIITTLLLALGIPCSAQLGVIMAMLAGQPPLALGIWLGVLGGVVLLVGQAASRLVPGDASPFLYEIPPLRQPKLSNILIKTLGRLEWYVREAVPLFFLGTLALFLLDSAGLLAVLERLASPVVVGWLGLPAKATAAFLIGFLRRDFGAAGFYALQRDGLLSGIQTVVSLVTITLFVPCIAQYFMMVKERGWKAATVIAVVVTGIALLTGGLLFRLLTTLRLLG